MSRSASRPSEPAPSRQAQAEMTPPVLFVLSAPSGAGKTTLCNQVLKTRPNLTRAITCTTRPPRPEERDGVDYFFLEAGDFLKRVQAGHFLEHATVYGNSYGTLKSEVLAKLRSGRDVLLNIDVQGAAAIRAAAEEDPELRRALVTVFLATPSLEVLERRLRKRGQDAPAAIQKRLGVARQELAQAKHFDYLIISGSVAEDVRRMEAVIDAEKMKQARVQLPVYE
jgi:guanylate kinase